MVIKTNANHVFVFSTSNGLTETWEYQSKYKQFELNYPIEGASALTQILFTSQNYHFGSLLRKKKIYGLWSGAENGTFFSGTQQKKKLPLTRFHSPQISQTTISRCKVEYHFKNIWETDKINSHNEITVSKTRLQHSRECAFELFIKRHCVYLWLLKYLVLMLAAT